MSFRTPARSSIQIALALLVVTTVSTRAIAQSDSSMKKEKKDAMAKDRTTKDATGMDGMKKDAMAKDGMEKDGMMKDGMAKDGMAKDGMMKDGMAKDGMMKDGMAKDGMAKDGMAKDGMAKDGMMKESMAKAVPHSVNLDRRGLSLHGYDPVAYFIVGRPVAGKTEFTATHEGAMYRFASASNRDAFTANPTNYTPQFGGYCAMGVALNKKLDVDPKAWRIVDGKLYLNVNRKVQRDWQKDVSGNIAKAVANWPAIRGLAASEL